MELTILDTEANPVVESVEFDAVPRVGELILINNPMSQWIVTGIRWITAEQRAYCSVTVERDPSFKPPA